MRTDKRSGTDATDRRVQPNWLVECLRAGVPLYLIPTPPGPDATHKEKCVYTWKLRKLWSNRTGRKIERLTPPDYKLKASAP